MGGEGQGVFEELSCFVCTFKRDFVSSHLHNGMRISDENYIFLDTVLHSSHAFNHKCIET
jgi:hypothetical protein